MVSDCSREKVDEILENMALNHINPAASGFKIAFQRVQGRKYTIDTLLKF